MAKKRNPNEVTSLERFCPLTPGLEPPDFYNHRIGLLEFSQEFSLMVRTGIYFGYGVITLVFFYWVWGI